MEKGQENEQTTRKIKSNKSQNPTSECEFSFARLLTRNHAKNVRASSAREHLHYTTHGAHRTMLAAMGKEETQQSKHNRRPAGIYTNGSTKSSTIWTRYFTMAQVIPYGLRIGRQIWECVEAPESNFSLIHVLFSILLQATFDKLHRVFNFSRCLFIFGVMRRRSNPKFGGFKRLQAHFRNDVQRFEKNF